VATLYQALSAALPTTAAVAKTSTGTAIKTLMQVATPSTMRIKVVEWGISLGNPASASEVTCELIQTDVAATTGTSFTPQLFDDPNGPASLCVGGTALTCFGPTVEGTITATRVGDVQILCPPVSYVYPWPLGREFQVPVSRFLRVRVTATVACNAIAYVIWEE